MELVRIMLLTKPKQNKSEALSSVQKGQSNDNAQNELWFNKERYKAETSSWWKNGQSEGEKINKNSLVSRNILRSSRSNYSIA